MVRTCSCLLQVVVETAERAIHYETVMIDRGTPVNSDLVMDRSKSHVYAVTGQTVSHIFWGTCCNTVIHV